ncbi:MAG: hypothetical protein QOI61_1498, partial [Actinomycetota bacterium]
KSEGAEIELAFLVRSNDDPLIDRVEWFDDDDLATAYAQLDALYDTPVAEGHHRLAAAFNRRDWDGLGDLFAPDAVQADHRPARLGEIRGRDRQVEAQRVVIDLAPDSEYRVDHELSDGRHGLAVMALRGTQDGGAFESKVVSVVTYDDDDRIARREVFDEEQARDAYALYDKIVAAAGPV